MTTLHPHLAALRPNYPTLTIENAKTARVIVSKEHPEWGTKRFNFDPSSDGFHTYGAGCNSAVLFEGEFHFWSVVA